MLQNMGRPATHTEDQFLDAATALFASGGARAVTMNAVARAVGAPSGSIFHRFPTRGSLLAAVWIRTVRRFQQEYADRLGSDPLTARGVVDATAWVVEWCRTNLSAALVLHAGVHAFEPDSWPEAARSLWNAANAEQERTLERLVAEIAGQTTLTPAEIAFVLFDLPLAAVRTSLVSRREPGPEAARLVRALATRLLGPASPDAA